MNPEICGLRKQWVLLEIVKKNWIFRGPVRGFMCLNGVLDQNGYGYLQVDEIFQVRHYT